MSCDHELGRSSRRSYKQYLDNPEARVPLSTIYDIRKKQVEPSGSSVEENVSTPS